MHFDNSQVPTLEVNLLPSYDQNLQGARWKHAVREIIPATWLLLAFVLLLLLLHS